MKCCVQCGTRCNSFESACPSCGHAPPRIGGLPAFAPELAEASEGFNPDYFVELAKLEAANFWFRSRNRLIAWALARYFPHARSLLEIGCGTGFVLAGIERAMPHLALSGSEIYSAGLLFAAQRVPTAHYFQMDARRIPFEEEFDVIGAFDVLEHIEEDEIVLCQMRRATKSNGGIIVTVPQHRFMWSQQDDYACHRRRYEAKELKRKVEAAGFEVLRSSSFVSLLLPFMMASRLTKRNHSGTYDGMAELRIGGIANMLLEKTMDVERLLIEAGVSFPAGGSRLLIARRN